MFKPVAANVNFPEMEKKLLDHWYKDGIVSQYLRKNSDSRKRFSFLDGPITANNPMGVHHGWGRTYKDLWQRFHNMKGEAQRFQNGFDCQGLWIEVEVEKELGIRHKKDIENLVPGDKKESIAKFVSLCKERVRKFSSVQMEQSKRLGYFMDWDNSYFTMSDENNYMIWHFLKVCHDHGWIYKGTESVPWCPRCETAISQHEMLTEDYKEISHKSIYMRLPLVGRGKEYLLVWTTTPWTIPANIAVAVDKTFDYILVEDKTGDRYYVAKDAGERLFGNDLKVIKTIKGKNLVGWRYEGAFDGLDAVANVSGDPKFHTVIGTDPLIMPINTTEGTGMVHTAVSAGEEDFKLGRKLGLPMIPVIADNADYLPGLGILTGQNAKKHPEIILDFMQEKGFAFKTENYLHRYPACWRCKTELVWKVADEWYIAMDKPSKIQKSEGNRTLRQRMIGVAKKINWIPEFGLERELDWLKNMHDWLISKKNRYWGLALPIYECTKCGWYTVFGSKEELKEMASSGWDFFEGRSPHKPYIDEVKVTCGKCRETISRISDVGNVWLDAGIVPYSTLIDPETKTLSYTGNRKYWKNWFPADFITESFPGQFKNWFYSMIAMSAALEEKIPYRTVLGYASVLGEDGRPMHKSWGNAIEFNEAADRIGVDVMRWMYVTSNPTANLLFGYRKADETRRKFHLLLWNIYNFFVTYANIDRWDSPDEKIADFSESEYEKLNILDKWILSRLNNTLSVVSESLEKFDAFTASTGMEKFISDMSLWYIRRSRDRVGPTVSTAADRENFYKTTYQVFAVFTRMLAPFNPFIADEIYTNLTGGVSVHLSNWPQTNKLRISTALEKEMDHVRVVVETGHSVRKANNLKVRQPLGKLTIKNSKYKLNSELVKLIEDELNIKEIEIKQGTGELSVNLDLKLTPQLLEEGEAREIIRQIQIRRKEMGCNLTDRVEIILPQWPEKFTDYICKETLATRIEKGEELTVKKI